jgi:hypothetical protein
MSATNSGNLPYLVHIVSIVGIAAVAIGINWLFFYYVKAPDDVSLLWWAFFNIASVVGMSYYLANVQVTATGLNETTTAPPAGTP